ncbi:MAG: hypothetical protein IT585_05230 [candidate division Zixibacteria bacterium]|nr:hypothetical protein [candidate division Zixibacteria bacterium]
MPKSTFSRNNRWRRAVTDPVLFCREFLELEPHPGQRQWLMQSVKDQNLLVTGNRWGKSLIQAAKLLHRAVYRIRSRRYDDCPRYRILNLSITQDQANIVFNNCLQLIRGKSLVELLVDSVVQTPYPRIVFGNGAEITARTSQNRAEHILGHDYDLISFDEVAFEPHVDYIVNEVLTMRLADRSGRLDLVSTPCGRNWFYRKYRELKARPESAYVQWGAAAENPNISQDFLEEKRSRLSPARVAQNLAGLFVDSDREILKEEQIQLAVAQSTGLASRMPEHRYVSGWDLARKETFTVGITLDITTLPYQLVKLERFQNRDWPFVYAAIRARKREYGGDTVIDATGVGDVVLAEVEDIHPIGFIFTTHTKAELLTNLQSQFAAGNVGLPPIETDVGGNDYWSLADELRDLNWDKNNHCDAAMALALALWGAKSAKSKMPDLGFRLGEV